MLPETRYLPLPETHSPAAPRVRGVLAVLFRQRKIMLHTFLAVLLGTGAAVLLMPHQYRAEMKVLVRRERVDPVVSSDTVVQSRQVRGLTEQEVNSEVDLLQSQDLLQRVALHAGLAQEQPPSWWQRLLPRETDPQAAQEKRTAQAVQQLQEGLRVDPPNKSNLISISFTSPDPQLSARVLHALGDFYLEKHLAVHRPAGAFDFFQNEAEQHKQELQELQQRVVTFNRSQGVVSAESEKQSTLATLARFEAAEQDLMAAIAETEHRIQSLESQAGSMPARVTTQVRTRSDLLQDLSTTLFNLQLKHSEMLAKYAPNYRPVQDLEQQIAETRAAIAKVESAPIREEITDENPIYQWVAGELAKSRSELVALRARRSANARNIRTYREKAQQLEQKGMAQQDLLRAARTAEENYLLYQRKQEEARMADALDRQRILNVAIAENATVPSLPDSSRMARLLAGLLLALLVSVGVAFARDYWDPSFRTPDEVRAYLNLPVLAAIPHRRYLLPAGNLVFSSETPDAPLQSGG